MNRAWGAIWRYIKRFFRWITGRKYRITAIRVEELPDKLDSDKVYLAGESDYLWFAAMVCPCGCDQILYMSLMPDQRPMWNVTVHHNGGVSLHPSVWRRVGCKSHFWLKHGHIVWHRG